MVASLNNTVKQNSYISPVVLHWPPSMHVVNDQFFEFCQANKELRIERTAQGDCEIMAPNEVLMGFELDMQKIWNAEF